MALRSIASPKPKPGKPRSLPGETEKLVGWKVERFPVVGAARLIDIGPDHACWYSGTSGGLAGTGPGSIVKLRPPADPKVSPEVVAEMATSMGAVAVRIAAPEPAADAVPAVERSRVGSIALRDVVAELVAASALPEDEREELSALCGSILEEVGA